MSDVVAQINERNNKLYGPACDKCTYYAGTCRCLLNTPWTNKDLQTTIAKTFVRVNNANVLQGTMEAPMQVLGRDLLEIMKNMELCGKTMTEVLEYINNNPDQFSL